MQRSIWGIVALSGALFFMAVKPLQAEIYRVIGPDGKVQFTDRPPAENSGQDSKVVHAQSPVSGDAFAIAGEPVTPVKVSPGSTKTLTLEHLGLNHKDAGFNSNPVVGSSYEFYPGSPGSKRGSCRDKEGVHLSTLKRTFSEASFLSAFDETLNKYGYPTDRSDDLMFARQESATADMSLGGKIIDVKVRYCGSGRAYLVTDSGRRVYGVDKASSRLTIEWQLFDNLRRKIVYTAVTEGADNGYLGDVMEKGIQVSMHEAFRGALSRLLADETFVSHLKEDGDRLVVPSKVDSRAGVSVRYRQGGEHERFSQRATELMPAVGTVRTAGGHGSGFVIGDGYVLTNRHVVGEARNVLVLLGEAEIPASVVARGDLTDVALLKLQSEELVPSLSLSSTEPGVGEELYIVGTPLHENLSHTVTRGVLSSVRMVEGSGRLFQTDAAVNPGNSGGPVFDQYGNVVALAVASLRDGNGAGLDINYLVPIREALDSLGIK